MKSPVTWPVVVIVCFVAGCLTVLIALGKDVYDLLTLIMVLLSGGAATASTFTAAKTKQIEQNVDGKMTRLMNAAGIPPEQVDRRHRE